MLGKRKNTRSWTADGNCDAGNAGVDDDVDDSIEVDGVSGKGISRVNLLPVASAGAKFVMTSFPGKIRPNG